MADTLTPNLGLTLPAVNDPAGEDLWGPKLNTNFTLIDTAVAAKADGAATTAALALKADKTYVDSQDAALQTNINAKASTSYVDSQNAAQNATIAAKADKTYVDSQDAAIQAQVTANTSSLLLKVDKTGDTGAAKVPAGTTAQQPGSPLAGYLRFNTQTGKFEGHNGTAWGAIGGGAAIGTSPPSNPGPGDFWWSSDLGLLFVYYYDGNTSQWVSTHPAVDPTLFYTKSQTDAAIAAQIAAIPAPAKFTATEPVTLTGTAVDFTSVPAGVRRVTMMIANASGNGSSAGIIQIGSGGVIEATGYQGSASYVASTSATGGGAGICFPLQHALAATTIWSETITLVRMGSTNKWLFSMVGHGEAGLGNYIGAGSKTLAGALDRLRLSFGNGTDVFDAGTASVLYE